MNADLELLEWIEERRQNTLRIAKTKSGEDRQGWLEDGAYFHRAGEAIKALIEASGENHANSPLRNYIALKILRAWNHGTEGYNMVIVSTINEWFDAGRFGPVPWPDSPFFCEWAIRAGFQKIGDYVGFRFQMEMVPKD